MHNAFKYKMIIVDFQNITLDLELFFSSQLKEQLDAVKGVRSKYFLHAEAVNDYMGLDVGSFFLMKRDELTEYKMEE